MKFPETGSATGTHPTHPYARTGTYCVSLTVTNSAGLSTGATGAISVATVPAPTFPTAGAISLNPSTGHAMLAIEATNGIQYRIAYKNDLAATNQWQPIIPPGWTNRNNGTITITDPGATNVPQRFYRIEFKSISAP